MLNLCVLLKLLRPSDQTQTGTISALCRRILNQDPFFSAQNEYLTKGNWEKGNKQLTFSAWLLLQVYNRLKTSLGSAFDAHPYIEAAFLFEIRFFARLVNLLNTNNYEKSKQNALPLFVESLMKVIYDDRKIVLDEDHVAKLKKAIKKINANNRNSSLHHKFEMLHESAKKLRTTSRREYEVPFPKPVKPEGTKVFVPFIDATSGNLTRYFTHEFP